MKKFIQGIAIGAGAILPGISSGVLCVIFGIYEKLLDSVLNFFKTPKKNIKILLPIIMGVTVGVLIFSNILNYFLYIYPIQMKSIFIGLILGTIPMLIKDVNRKAKFKVAYIIFCLMALVIGIVSVIVEKNISIRSVESFSFAYLMMSGIVMSVGIIVPGVSSTIILMLMGVYSVYLNSVSNLYLPVLIPIGIGLIIGGLFFMKITNILLNRFYAQTFYTIIGFTLGSILVLLPDFSNVVEILIAIFCMCLGLLISNFIGKREK